MERTIYYSDELNDEFSEAVITAREIGDNYKYDGGPFRWLGRIFWYHMIAKPFAFLYLKIFFGYRIKNKKVLRAVRHKGYFLYGNHTNPGPDAVIPTVLNFWGSTYAIVHANNVSMPVMGNITPSLGALPLPDSKMAMKNFTHAIEDKVKRGKCVAIYPEAHIWPYYTKIRPFVQASFGYPLQYDVPVYCFTNTYQKRLFFKKPRIVTYVDGPFITDTSLPKKDQKMDLRNQVYNAMVERSKNNTVEYVRYIKQ